MPPVQMFGRQWRISSDDFVCPGLTELLVRLAWLTVITALIALHLQETEYLKCLGMEYNLTTFYLGTTLVLLVITSCNSALLASQSARGRMFDTTVPHPRRWVEPLLYINILLTLGECVWTGIGTYFTVRDYVKCISESSDQSRSVILAVLVMIAVSYLLLFLKVLLVLLSFRPFSRVAGGAGGAQGERELLVKRSRQEAELHYRGLRCIAPCTRDEHAIQAFRDIASLLGRVFADSELVPSDVVAGLVLLSHQRNRQQQWCSGRAEGRVVGGEPTQECAPGPLAPLDWAGVRHYYRYASAAYGYWWWLLDRPGSHCWRLARALHCTPHPRPGLTGDGWLMPNLAAIQAMLDLPDEDILMFDNNNRIEETPFFLAVDRPKHSLVVAIRGTLSLHDMLTDLRGQPGPLLETGEQPDWTGHQGIVNAARSVYRRVEASLGGVWAAWDIVVTGHSLGAGTATVLGFLLRSAWPGRKVSCFAFSPPGGLLSWQAALAAQHFTVSLVVGDDVIPRTSLANIASLSSRIRSVAAACRLAKHAVLGWGCLACCCRAGAAPLQAELDRLFPQGADPAASPVHTPTAPAPAPVPTMPSLYLPGRVLHLLEEEDGGLTVTEVERQQFNQILVSPSMLADHLPNKLARLLLQSEDTQHITARLV